MPSSQRAHQQWNKVKIRARELRKVQTPAEQALWNKLRNRGLVGLKFRRQHPIGPYIADYYCAKYRLLIKLDGGIHFGQKEQDADRTAQFELHGYHVLRVWNAEVETDLDGVLRKIISACDTIALLPDLGEGQADFRPPG